jgi:hypothetical protein
MSARTTSEGGTEALRDLLVWARTKGFRLREVEMEGVRVVVDDLRVEAPGAAEELPRDAHEAWAKSMGFKLPPVDPDDPDNETRAQS